MKFLAFTFLSFFTCLSAQASDTLKCPGGYFDSTLNIQVYEFVETDPTFPGGEAEMIRFIQQNLVYPEMSKEMGEQGTAYVRFIVTETGEVTSVEIFRHRDQELTPFEQECIRVIELMPDWSPGLCNGAAVAVKYQIPVKVCL